MNRKVTILPSQILLTAEDGTNLLDLLRRENLAPNAVCGGNGTCGKCRVLIDGHWALACKTLINSDMTVEIAQQTKAEILTSGQSASIEADPIQDGYQIAFDIGTTTVVCYLLSPSGQELSVQSMLNPQCAYGADVISRIQHALSGGLEQLTASIRGGMSELIQRCCESAEITPEEIGVVSVVGNPCMQQLFLGISPKNLASVPFPPVLCEAEIQPAVTFLPLCPNASLLTVPDISGYVGGDTVSCVLASQIYRSQETVLLVDIGTNGEMILAHQGNMVACSTAAGPALEGANIHFGMRGTQGAIDHVWLDGGRVSFSVIGGGSATGICGSGLIDAIAALLDQELINKRGRLQSSDQRDGDRIVSLSEEIYLTQSDIRQVQLAKGAIAAGITLMCEHFGISPGAVDHVILAGAFGSFLSPESACRIGLLPRELYGKITAAGNLAGSGAKMMAINQALFHMTQELVGNITFLELAAIPSFQRCFAKNMTFPE